jgi:hypothetical protein
MGNFDNIDRMGNGFFKHLSTDYDNEKLLYQHLLAESINIGGVPCTFYVTNHLENKDSIIGESTGAEFVRKFPVNLKFTLPDESNLSMKYGIGGLDNFHAYASMLHFEQTSQGPTGCINPTDPSHIPKIGDVLLAKHNNMYYELVDVGAEANDSMFLQKKHAWDFILRPFINRAYNNAPVSLEEINTILGPDSLAINDYIVQNIDDIIYEG